MKYPTRYFACATAGFLTVFAVPAMSANVPDNAITACMMAVNSNYGGNVNNLDVVSSEFSQANSEVVLNADGERWRCLVSNDGEVQDLSVLKKHSAVGYGGTSSSAGGYAFSGRTSGQCKLKNVKADKELYKGGCSIKETISGSSAVYEITMGSAESFLFATSDGRTWMHGPERVQFEDAGNTGTFRWSDFKLKVETK